MVGTTPQNELIAGREPIDYDGGMPDEVSLTLRDLLRDPVYKKWFLRIPELQSTAATSPPWYLYLLDNGKWKRANATTYRGALKFAAKNLREYQDIVIHSKRQPFRIPRLRRSYNPPQYKKVKGKKKLVEVLEVVEWENYPHDYMWCPYCRRPTLWNYYMSHHAFPQAKQWVFNGRSKACHVCGLRDVEAIRINAGRNYNA